MINQALFSNFSKGQKDNCQTVEGKKCVFPFVYNGNTYNGCTIDESVDDLAWCATGVDRNRKVYDEAWGDCKSGCPGYGGNENIFLIISYFIDFFYCSILSFLFSDYNYLPIRTYLSVFLDKINRTPPEEECIGAYLNRKYVISRKTCIDDIRGIGEKGRLFIRKNTQNICQKNNQTLIKVEKTYEYGEIVLLEIPKVC